MYTHNWLEKQIVIFVYLIAWMIIIYCIWHKISTKLATGLFEDIDTILTLYYVLCMFRVYTHKYYFHGVCFLICTQKRLLCDMTISEERIQRNCEYKWHFSFLKKICFYIFEILFLIINFIPKNMKRYDSIRAENKVYMSKNGT